MLRRGSHIVLSLLLLFSLPLSSAWAAQTPEQARQELRQRLGRLAGEQERLARTLRDTKNEITEIDGLLGQGRAESAKLTDQEARIGRRLEEAETASRTLSERITRESQGFHDRLRALYLFGPEASATLWAGSQNFSDALTRSRAMTRILASDQTKLASLREKRGQAAMLRSELILKQNELTQVRAELKRLQAISRKMKQERLALIEALKQRSRSLAENIKALKDAEIRLARTFALGLPAYSDSPGASGGVTRARGWLSPPVEGKVRGRSGPNRRGIEMSARPGSPVRSPWSGQVVYAGILSGYGRVLVLDHGERVHTVLPQLGALSVEKGDLLTAGQVVGAVGGAGSLYLEVRRGARPENPMAWLKLGR